MTPHKLPSGRWNVRVMIDGKSYSVTANKKTECRNQASALIEANKRKERDGIMLSEAITGYIESKRNVLSPSTVCIYEKYAQNHFQGLQTFPVGRITSLDIQQAINEESARLTKHGKQVSAKTVKNAYGLVSAALHMARPDFNPVVTLPKSVRTFRELPDPKDVIAAVKGTDIELPCLLAMWMSLTASEIRGIKVSSIKNGILTIDESVIRLDGVDVHKKQAKTYTRNRRIMVPKYIMDLIKKTDAWQAGEGYIETRTGQALYDRLQTELGKKKIQMRFHDLRHLFVSVGSEKLKISERTLMDLGGWSTPHTMKQVYTHSFEQDRFNEQKKIDSYFMKIIGK